MLCASAQTYRQLAALLECSSRHAKQFPLLEKSVIPKLGSGLPWLSATVRAISFLG
jgi:hypothetical protein